MTRKARLRPRFLPVVIAGAAGLLALALAQHFFHAGAEVRVVSVQVIVDEHVGIARDLQ